MSAEQDLVSILIVDDSPENLLLMRTILRKDHYNIYEASSGREALELFAQNEFAVILLDIQMPEMNGYETAHRLREMNNGHSTPIIFVTAGMIERNQIQLGYASGAVDYLLKPVDHAILRAKVRIFSDLYLAKLEIKKQARLLHEIDENNRRSFLENALDAVIGMDEKLSVNYWNIQAEKIFGWKKTEVMTNNVAELLIPSRLKEKFKRGVVHFLRTGRSPIMNRRFESLAKRKNGQEFPVEISITPIRIHSHYSFSAFIRDISQRKLEEANLQQAIQARDEFIGICSHELKTPLTAMKLQFQMAERSYRMGEKKIFQKDEIIKRIEATNTQLTRMSQLVENMLDVTRMSSAEISLSKEEVSLLKIIEEAMEDFSALEVEIKLKNLASHDRVFADPLRIEQVISNLLSNAIKYGKGHPVELRVESIKKKCIVSVIDQGIGIEAKDLKRIFERYERAITRTEVSGLGLGLYIGQKIIKAHGGELLVTSNPGVGSTFSIVLPLHQKRKEISY